MSKQYRLRTHVRGHAAGEIVTEEQLKESGHDSADLVRRNAMEEVSAAEAKSGADTTGTPGMPRGQATDEQNKLNIENAIRNQTVEQGKALSQDEQDKLAAKVTKDSGRPQRTGPGTAPGAKDVTAAEKAQEKTDARNR